MTAETAPPNAGARDFPPAPWRLRGHGLLLLRTVAMDRARSLVPPPLRIVSVAPGRTVGGLWLGAYGAGSTLAYHELIAVPALVRYGHRVGAWVSHIWVDDARAAAGGRTLWGLPKALATFDWPDPLAPAVVREGAQTLCTLEPEPPGPHLGLPGVLPTFGRDAAGLLGFRATGTARVASARIRLDCPADSPLWGLDFRTGRGLHLARLDLRVRAPVRLHSPGAAQDD